MNQEEADYMQKMNTYIQQKDVENVQLKQAVAGRVIDKDEQANLVKWQLDIEQEKAQLEILLKSLTVMQDPQGNQELKEGPKEERVLNDAGVREIMIRLSVYINKVLILSNYDDEEIAIRTKQFAHAFKNFLFCNYERLGLDTTAKRSYYDSIVWMVVDTVDHAYHRALHGGERTSLRTARTVHQTENPMGMMGMGMPMMMGSQKKTKWYNPTTWIGK